MSKQLKPSALFTDGAVLCRGKEIRLFGEAPEGVCVSAALADAAGKVLAAGKGTVRDGKFLISLPPQEAQAGCRLTFTAGAETASWKGFTSAGGGEGGVIFSSRSRSIPIWPDSPLSMYSRIIRVISAFRSGSAENRLYQNTRSWYSCAMTTSTASGEISTEITSLAPAL